MENTKVIYKAPGITTILFVVFLVLKLCNVITWSWWWVTAPLWMPFMFLIVMIFACALIFSISEH